MKKKEVRECVRGCQNCIFLYELEGPIDDLIETLNDIKESAEALGYKDIKFEPAQEMECKGNIFDVINVIGTRTETNKEVKNRKEKERKMEERRKKENAFYKAKEEEREFKEYLRLKKKFGGKTDNEKLL